MTNLRVNFTRLFTLGDTLLGRKRRNPQEKYYYALYEMVVRGSCFCNGHASQCMPVENTRGDVFIEPGMVHGRCVCHHNTAGNNCERCQDFYNDTPWRPGGQTDLNACQRCNCNGHSERCHFDAAVYLASGRVSGGVCEDCKNNRVGTHCEQCRPFYYQDPRLPTDHPNACIPCNCDPDGSLNGGLCDPSTGRCVCKNNVEGDRCNPLGSVQTPYPCDPVTGECSCQRLAVGPLCDQCLPGYWGLGNTVYRCSPCDCDIGGAYNRMCSPADGQCQCRPNMEGRSCSSPTPGHFLAPLDFYLYEAEHAAPIDRRFSSLVNPTLLPQCKDYYRERGYDFKYSNGRFTLVRRAKRRARQRRQNQIPVLPGSGVQLIPRQRIPGQPVTWTGPGFVRLQDGWGLRFTVNNLPVSLDYALVIRYEPEASDDWAAIAKVVPAGSPGDGSCSNQIEKQTLMLPGSGRMSVLDPFACLNRGGEYHIDIVFERRTNTQPEASSFILIDSMGLVPKIESLQNFCSQHSLDEFRRYRCVEMVLEAGLQVLPDVCESLISSMSAQIHSGAVPCECDPNGSLGELCDQVSGRCPCRPEAAGRRCDQCQPGYFGFPQCRPCQCNGMADHCDPVTGVCLGCRDYSTGPNCYFGDPIFREPCEPCLCPDTQDSGRFFASSCSKDDNTQQLRCACNPGHTGPRCDHCSPGFYGDLSLAGGSCEKCRCNGNIDPRDRNSCDSLTGECLRCLHSTYGSECQYCKPGYYGDALAQDCKACACDPRGTEITLCPVGSPCRCDQATGACSCRRGVTGPLCNECEDGFWNFGSGSGCQPCACDSANSLSNLCNKSTGQCPCQPEYGGRQCDECGENYFGNPDLQCISCDCNMEGTERPACDPSTGDCMCRPGVTGIFCDECGPGHDSKFPECTPCHACSVLWAANVTDLRRAMEKMRTLVPRSNDQKHPAYTPRWKKMEDMLSTLDWLRNATALTPPELMDVEDLCTRIKMLKDSIDPHAILIDTSSLLNTDIDNIKYEFNRLLDRLRDKIKPIPITDPKAIKETLEKIKKYHAKDEEAQKQMKRAKDMLQSSKDKRREAKERLDNCPKKDWAGLEKKVKALSVANLNEDVCGAPGDAKCSEAKCGGALCRDALGARECGGPTCKGSLPISQNASKLAEEAENRTLQLLQKMKDSDTKINKAKQQAQDTKDQAEKMKKRINDSKDKFEKEKNGTKELIKRVKDYLQDEMVAPEDIEQLARAVLAIQLPAAPDVIRSMINKIQDILVNCTDLKEDLNKLQDHVKTAREMLEKAKEIQEKTKSVDVGDIKKAIDDAEKRQDEVKKNLEKAKRDKDNLDETLNNIEKKLSNAEINLDPQRVKDLLDATEALKNKMEMNKQQAKDAKDKAEAAEAEADGVQKDLANVTALFEKLKRMGTNQSANEVANERLKNITMEAEKLAKVVQDKMKQAEDLERKIEDLLRRKDEKVEEVIKLLAFVESLRKEIADKAAAYINCSN
ncbi:hypothetical protein JZ751_009045 [Albula glossodonta]|uniref:Uncharacterized protein n=1 Tax=Albula glossodonta TaxID=121402 RepID=A0A8T2P0M8_9TELE|nr:hypothetical protein JZ751_009045 [Albula glossodonta]